MSVSSSLSSRTMKRVDTKALMGEYGRKPPVPSHRVPKSKSFRATKSFRMKTKPTDAVSVSGSVSSSPPKLPTIHRAVAYEWSPDEVWKTTEVLVTVTNKPFANGAQRECFHMKLHVATDDDLHWTLTSKLDALTGVGPSLARKMCAKFGISNSIASLYEFLTHSPQRLPTLLNSFTFDEKQRALVKASLRDMVADVRRYVDTWKASGTVIAKSYMEYAPPSQYFEDVKLAEVARQWADRFNESFPPKRISFLQSRVVQLFDDNGTPLDRFYAVEPALDGEYCKHNNNTGCVFRDADDCQRSTPQAFSHFTFERSGHRLMVCDIQGVGDTYTDPQVHTSDGRGFGDGNLGLRGMALFFSSHTCTPLCKLLGLVPFRHYNKTPLMAPNLKVSAPTSTTSKTSDDTITSFTSESTEALAMTPPPPRTPVLLMFGEDKKTTTAATTTMMGEGEKIKGKGKGNEEGMAETTSPRGVSTRVGTGAECSNNGSNVAMEGKEMEEGKESREGFGKPDATPPTRRRTMMSVPRKPAAGDTGSRQLGSLMRHATVLKVPPRRTKRTGAGAGEAKPPKGPQYGPPAADEEEDVSASARLLGAVHYDIAVCVAIGRMDSGLPREVMTFHLSEGARHGFSEAQYALARLYTGVEVEPFPAKLILMDSVLAKHWLLTAAKSGVRPAMIDVANLMATGKTHLAGREITVAVDVRSAIKMLCQAGRVPEGLKDMWHPNYRLLVKAADLEEDQGRPAAARQLVLEAADAAGAAGRFDVHASLSMRAETLLEEG